MKINSKGLNILVLVAFVFLSTLFLSVNTARVNEQLNVQNNHDVEYVIAR